MFDELNYLPDGFLDVSVGEIARILPRPTLIHLAGRRQPAAFVSILLHGNEGSGLLAVQDLLRRYQDAPLPRNLSLFVGNVDSCTAGVRYLPGQVDFNRAWPGSELPRSPTHELLETVTERVLERGVFVSVDIHNNTGRNPLYGCICVPSTEHIYLASMFSETIVYFIRPRGVQTQAFSPHCPAVTLECGQVGDEAGVERAAQLIADCLELDEFPRHRQPQRHVQIFHTVARIRVREHCSLGFAPGTDVVLRDDLDSLNFVELAAGENLGTLSGGLEECFLVSDEHGRDVTDQYLTCSSQRLLLGRAAMPSMFTRNVDIIRQDCLGYLMERLPIE